MRERRLGVHMEFSHLPQEDDLIHPYWFILLLPAVETTCWKSHTSNKEKTRSPWASTVCLPALGVRKLRAEQEEETDTRTGDAALSILLPAGLKVKSF